MTPVYYKKVRVKPTKPPNLSTQETPENENENFWAGGDPPYVDCPSVSNWALGESCL